MKKALILLIMVWVTAISGMFAQKSELVSGNLDFLRGADNINIEFRYDQASVGEYKTESEFIAAKVAELNKDKPGKGDKWLARWNEDKIVFYEPYFLKYLNKALAKNKIVAIKSIPGTGYTMVVDTKFIEKGWDTYVTMISSDSEVRLDVLFYEGSDRDKEIARISVVAAGSGGAIYSAYALAGKVVGKIIKTSLQNN